MDIANVIREARRARGYSQRTLASKMKVAPSAVGQWETSVTLPSMKHRSDLTAVLGIPFADLLPEHRGGKVETDDPQTVALVRQFEVLPPPVREAILIQVSATAEALKASEPTPQPEE